MAYTPNLDDLPEENKKGYVPSIEDIEPENTEIKSRGDVRKLLNSNRTPVDTIRDLLQGALVGAGKGGQFIGEQMMKIPGAQNLANYVQRKTGISVPDVDIEKEFSSVGSPNRSIAGEIEKGIGSYLPYGAAGGAGLIGQAIAGATHGAATANPDQQNLLGFLPQGKYGSAIESALLNTLTHGAIKGVNALRPSNLLRGNLSPEELQENLRASQGTNTPLGDVIGYPFLKRQFENVITKLPFSNASQLQQKAAQQVTEKGENLLSSMLGEANPETAHEDLIESLKENHSQHQKLKNELYKDVDRKAEESNLKLELPTFAKKAQQYSDAIDQTNILKTEPESKQLFAKLQNYKNPVVETNKQGSIVDASGNLLINEKEIKYPTLKEANILKGKLNEYANMYKHSPNIADRRMSSVFQDLASSLKGDIKNTIDESGNKELKNAYEEAEKNYKENYSQFLDKAIYPFLTGKKDPDTLLSTFLKTSKTSDRSNLLQKLSDTLGESSKSLPYAYFSRAFDNEGSLNPNKLKTLINNLGKKQFEVLVPDQSMRQSLKDYSRLTSMNSRSLANMFNPMTGQQNLDILPTALSALAGSKLGAAKGLLTGMFAPGLASRPITNFLTSPEVREKLVQSMLKQRKINKNVIPAAQVGIQGLYNQG